ncbi:putative penicillin-binding protein [Aspergillus cavernicola]|uniref:Penicillin-binding protein n=1 Tax=Aspergillus cavernicola TaxID=176166 RepID=A0ABR4HK41_9EURO
MRLQRLTYAAALIQLCLIQAQNPLQYPSSSPEETLLDDAFNRKVLEHFHIPGLAISIVHDGKAFAQGYGYSGISTSTPVTENTLFFTGSTTKAHTSAAISLLMDDNNNFPQIQWNTPIHTLLPSDFTLSNPSLTSQITITDMLSHRSGLPRHDIVLLQNITTQQIIQRTKHLPLTAEIRMEFHYFEVVSGLPIATFLKERLWTPLGMDETYMDIEPAGRYITRTSTARGMSSRLCSDYANWVSALLEREAPISKEGYTALFGAHSIVSGVVSEPFSGPNYKGHTLIQHGGSQDGFGALVVMLPGEGFGVTVLGNEMVGTNGASWVLAFELIDRVLGVAGEERFGWEALVDAQLQQSKLTNDTLSALYPTLPPTSELLPYPLDLSSYEGIYTHPAYPILRISSTCPERTPLKNPEKWTGSRLCASFENHAAFASELELDIFHVTGTYWTLVFWFAGRGDAARVEFRISPGGGVSEVGVDFEPGMKVRGEKIWLTRV